jgi:hypothetical protein
VFYYAGTAVHKKGGVNELGKPRGGFDFYSFVQGTAF